MSFGISLVPALVYAGQRLRCAIMGHELDPIHAGVTFDRGGYVRGVFRCTRCGGRARFTLTGDESRADETEEVR